MLSSRAASWREATGTLSVTTTTALSARRTTDNDGPISLTGGESMITTLKSDSRLAKELSGSAWWRRGLV